MSEETSKKDQKEYIGKFKLVNTIYGPMYSVVLENTERVDKDGNPNQFFKGEMFWIGKDGRTYKVLKMSLSTPKNGMHPKQIENGFIHNVILNLDLDKKYPDVAIPK